MARRRYTPRRHGHPPRHRRRRFHRLELRPPGARRGRRRRPVGGGLRQADLRRQPRQASPRSPAHPRFAFVQGDIADRAAVRRRLSASTAPPPSSTSPPRATSTAPSTTPSDFVRTNVVGAFELLEAARRHLKAGRAARPRALPLPPRVDRRGLRQPRARRPLLGRRPPTPPTPPTPPRRPAPTTWCGPTARPTRLPAIVTNCSNNYGPYQFPEKLVPLMILNAARGRDAADLRRRRQRPRLALRRGPLPRHPPRAAPRAGRARSTTSAARTERTNLEMVDAICAALERGAAGGRQPPPARAGVWPTTATSRRFVPDRPGHDRRYAIDDAKVRDELGWRPGHDLAGGLAATVRWYLDHRDWCEAVRVGQLPPRAAGAAGREGARRPPCPACWWSSRWCYRDSRGFFLETYHRDRYRRGRDRPPLRPGQPLALGGADPARAPRPAPAARRASWCGRSPARSSTWRWTSAAARRPSPAGSARCCRRTTTASSASRPGFAHGFCVLSEAAEVEYKVHRPLRPRRRADDRLGRPRDRDRLAGRGAPAVGQGPRRRLASPRLEPLLQGTPA